MIGAANVQVDATSRSSSASTASSSSAIARRAILSSGSAQRSGHWGARTVAKPEIEERWEKVD